MNGLVHLLMQLIDELQFLSYRKQYYSILNQSIPICLIFDILETGKDLKD